MFLFRKAKEAELDVVYKMGIDIWGKNFQTEEDYLNDCRNNKKFKEATWYVLTVDEKLASSLIVYNLGSHQYGFGSIATEISMRKKGYAGVLINLVIQEYEQNDHQADFYLYSDIDPTFYQKFGFISLSPNAQRYKTTTCMIRTKQIKNIPNQITDTPEYF